MRKSNVLTASIAVLVLSVASAAALAQTPAPAAKKGAAADAKFKVADLNGDGGLSKDELAKTGADAFPAIKKHFDEMDANKDGKVTEAERATWMQAHKAAKPAKK